jgi:dihydroflavonol-4-reductase
MKLAFSGATGFVGRHALPLLAEAGHQVLCLSRSGGLPQGLSEAHLAGLEARSVDARDVIAMEQALQGCEVLIHSVGLVSHEPADAARTWSLHAEATQASLKAAQKAGVRRVVYLSTSGTIAVSKDDQGPLDETNPAPIGIIDRWPYYRSKLFAEQLAFEQARSGLELICLNPSLLLGPGDDELGKSTDSVKTFLQDGVPLAPPGGMAFVDVRDVAQAILQSLTRGRPGERYLLNAANLSFYEFFARLGRIADKPAPMGSLPGKATRSFLRWLPDFGKTDGIGIGIGARVSRPDMELAAHYWYASWEKAAQDLGWSPRDPTRTLVDTVEDIQGRRSVFGPFA